LLWPMGKAVRALVIAGRAVVVVVAFVAATGPAGVLALFAMLVGWGFVALLAGGLYLLFRRPRIDPHYAARWATREDTLEMVMWEEGRHPGEGVSLGVHYGELVGVAPGFEGRREMGHFLVCGLSRSGKSLHLITNLLVWQGSAVALDIKGELYRLTAGVRREMGDGVFALDPQGRGSRYDPFKRLV
jgi:type IV secretory pathway TraG/TraD family ATPase VirD4